MKKILILTAVAVALLMLVGCGAKQKMQDKITEKIIETTLGANVDIDGEEVTVKGEDGSVSFGSTEWPDNELANKIPRFKDGKITSAIKSEGYLFIIIEEVNEKDFNNYYEQVKSAFTEEAYESTFEGSTSYSAMDKDETAIIISYSLEEETLSIQASLKEKTE